MRIKAVLIMALLGAACWAACQGNVEPAGAPSDQDVAGRADPTCATPADDMIISSDTVICPGAYTIKDAGRTGILLVQGQGISLSMDNVIMRDPDGRGWGVVLENGAQRIDLSGGTFENFGAAVAGLGGLSDISISRVSIIQPRTWTILIAETDNRSVRIIDNVIEAQDHDNPGLLQLACYDCRDSEIVDNRFSDATRDTIDSDIIIEGGAHNRISGNTIVSRNEKGCGSIWLNNTQGNSVTDNRIDVGFKDALHVQNSRDSVISGNRIRLYLLTQNFVRVTEGSSNNLIFNNVFDGSGAARDIAPPSRWCENGIGNTYLSEARYIGKDACTGSCCRN